MSHPLLTILAYENNLIGNNIVSEKQNYEKPIQNRRRKISAYVPFVESKIKIHPATAGRKSSVSNPVKASQAQSNQIKPPPPPDRDVHSTNSEYIRPNPSNSFNLPSACAQWSAVRKP